LDSANAVYKIMSQHTSFINFINKSLQESTDIPSQLNQDALRCAAGIYNISG